MGTSTPSTVTSVTTVRDKLNNPALGKFDDTLLRAPLGDILSIMLDVGNVSTTVPATTVGTLVTQTSAAVTATVAVNPANSAYTQADQTTIAALANAERTVVDQLVADVTALTTLVNAARVDILALRSALAVAVAAATVSPTDTLSVTSNVATLSQSPTPAGLVNVNATAGTAKGVKQIVTDPTIALSTGQVYWNGGTGLLFAAADGVTACTAIYSKSDLSQKVSALLQVVAP